MTEADLAQALRKRLYMSAPTVHLVAVPNAGKRTPWAVRQAKKEGMAKGFCDLIVIAPEGRVAFIELKLAKGKVSEDQAGWIDRLDRYGFPVAVVRSVDEGVAFLRSHGFPVREAA